MNIIDLIDNVKEGRITSTHDYCAPVIKTNEDSIRHSTFLSIIEAINRGHLQGELDFSTEVPNYKNLRLTPKGENFHKYSRLTIDQIKEPTLWRKIYSGIISAISGKLVIIIIGLLMLYLFPNIESQIKYFFDYTMFLITSFIA